MSELVYDYEIVEKDGFISHYPMTEYEKKCFDLGKADERANVTNKIDAVIQYIKDNSIYCNIEDKRFKVFGSNVLINLLEQIKEQSND